MNSERETIKKNIEFIKASKELNQYKIFNNEYTKLTDKLNLIDEQISNLTGYADINIEALMDELKFSVIYKHFTKADKDEFNPVSLASIGAWCGAGTAVFKNLQDETPESIANSYKIDQICRKHDLNYLHSHNREEIHEADIKMLMDIVDTFIVKETKEAVSSLTSGNITQFKDYIFNSIYDIVDTPGHIASNIFDKVKNLSSQVLRERVLGMVAFAGIGTKLLYDLALGKKEYVNEKGELTNNVYGWEKTQFKLEDVDYIIKDIERVQNYRLQEAGFEHVNFNDLLKYDIDDLELKFKEDEEMLREDEDYIYDDEELIYSDEENISYNEDYMGEEEEEEEDPIDPIEQKYLNDLLDLLKLE